MEERRKYVRLDKELALTLERKGPTGTLQGVGVTKNISPTGLCIVTKAPLGVGEKVTVALVLPKVSQPVCLEARVKWACPHVTTPPAYEVGIEISHMADIEQNQYLLFICDIMCEQLARQKLL